ncbi:MAG: glycoside hydrolase domain-containing protein, partial [Microbacteriaceae bacterium]
MRSRRGAAVLSTAALAGLAAAVLVAPAPAAVAAPAVDPAGLVNTFIGTLDEGNTFPGASAPFGMTQVSPTGDHFAGWQYDETDIRGFGHSYVSGAGCWEQGGLLSALPTTGSIGPGADFDTADPTAFDHREYAATLSHDGEVGEAGYYRTALTSYGGIDVEATATTRVGVQRYTFPATDEAHVFLNTGQANETLKVPSSRIQVLDDRTVATEVEVQGFCTGQDFTYTAWFVSTFDRPFDSFGTWNDEGGQPDVAEQPAGAGLKGGWFTFDTTDDRDVQVSTAMSYTSPEGAERNLAAEGLDATGAPIAFDAVRDATRQEWNTELEKALVHGGTPDDQVSFYTALYHAF